MRLARQYSLLLLLFYVLAVAGLGWWARDAVDAAARSVMDDTAYLVATEVAAAVDAKVVEELLEGEPDNRIRLLNQIFDMTRRSAVVRRLEVVDAQGEVFAGEFDAVGEHVTPPSRVFAGSRTPRLLSEGGGLFPTAWVLALPLEREGELVGYLRLDLDTSQVGALYADLRRRLLEAAFVGLLLVGGLAYGLHLQLHRRSQRLVAELERASGGAAPAEPARAPRDEFGAALAVAGRLGRELQLERSRSERADRRLQSLAHGMDVGLVLLARDRSVEFATERAERLLGLPERPTPADWQEALAPLEGFLQEAAADRANGAQRDIELSRPGQPPRRIRFQVYPLNDQGTAGFLVQARDRDLLQSIEVDLRLAAQLRALNRLYRGVAHDLRAPLNAMVLNLELLKRSLDPEAPPRDDAAARQQRWVGVIEQELQRLRRALDVLLAQTAPPSESPEKFDLRDVIEEIAELLHPQARQQRVTLERRLPERSVPVMAHRDQVKQAVLNLAINGLEAMPEGGELRLAVDVEDGRASIRVADTGPGIPPDLRDRIFDMHFTTKQSGTGIGLYVARSIFEAQGGTVRTEDTGPAGTTFQLTLPLLEQGS